MARSSASPSYASPPESPEVREVGGGVSGRSPERASARNSSSAAASAPIINTRSSIPMLSAELTWSPSKCTRPLSKSAGRESANPLDWA
eukprot:CAMPEP_0180054596 /NCGR_PEP_ID=MMETSP0985-20121206/2912_1 /TAXON_ID=483367 /ORGANISM="non described non described, Strain CCMP 2436" /LENGTH=88 /DNA_ID=CAMNT_0021984201 /DNA_START=323 /DNA_END=589 /DNA_ORIENTATION=+